MSFTPKWIIGRRIVAVDLNPWPTGRGRRLTYDPVITLDSGARLTFSVDETESLEYGVSIDYHKPRRRKDVTP